MQKAKMQFFKDRSLFYSTFPVREQGKKGVWDFYLLPVYFIAILAFKYDEKEEERKFRRDLCLKDQDGDVFYDKLHFRFLQMPLLIKDIERNPFSGIGKPEPLKHPLSGFCSRRIDGRHGLVYAVETDTILVAQCRDHY